VADQFPELSDELSQFISSQKVFFVATAAPDGRVNLSPKGQESLRVLNPNEILWMNLTGSGNETAAHLSESNRMTMMWCALKGRHESFVSMARLRSFIRGILVGRSFRFSCLLRSERGSTFWCLSIWYKPPVVMPCLSWTMLKTVACFRSGLRTRVKKGSQNTGKRGTSSV